jgi:glycosyltransferase involved in cell wall biosynthesis
MTLNAGHKDTVYTVLPTGSFHGWGVCGKYIVKELSKLADVRLLALNLDPGTINDVFDYRLLKSRLIRPEETAAIRQSSSYAVPYPVLQTIDGNSLMPVMPNLRGTVNVGYTFFEDNILPPDCIENGRRYFDTVVTGSSWCEETLKNHGLTNLKTVIQGIDPAIFHTLHSEKEYLNDAFVVFSGGKFELRKGQDIVIRAYKALQDKFRDVMLITSWFNQWPFSFQTMAASPHIAFSVSKGDPMSLTKKVLHDNGIDTGRVISLPLYPNIMMPRIFKNTDIGLFPNRCEGGTNLVLMEYMACGKPVIASYNTGHKDILTDQNSIKLTRMKPFTFTAGNRPKAVWEEPDIDETIEKLEWAYHNRDSLKAKGIRAGEDLGNLTWEHTARNFFRILKPG